MYDCLLLYFAKNNLSIFNKIPGPKNMTHHSQLTWSRVGVANGSVRPVLTRSVLVWPVCGPSKTGRDGLVRQTETGQ